MANFTVTPNLAALVATSDFPGNMATIDSGGPSTLDSNSAVSGQQEPNPTGHGKAGSSGNGGKHYSYRVVLAMGNNVILIAVCIFLLIHIIICIYQIVYRWVAGKIPLYVKCRNGQRLRGRYDYIVTLVTGSRSDSGTYGNVRMKLQGQNANSGDIVLVTALNETVIGLPLLKRGHMDAFMISSREYLGDLRYMEVELLTDSVAESWYLCYVTVLDLGNQTHWYLPCHRWFKATIDAPNIKILLAESVDCYSLFLSNFYRGFRELHLWLSPWCSSLLATRLQMLYSLTLCYCSVSCLMFVYMFVYYAPIGAPHHGSEKNFTIREWVYLVISSFFIMFMVTVLQLLMRIVSLKTGAFLSNYTIICIENSGFQKRGTSGSIGRQSALKYAGDRNSGNNITSNNDENVNWNACEAEGMLEKWEKIWHEVKPENDGYGEVDAGSWVSVLRPDALESWLRPLVEGLCSADVKVLDDSLNLESIEQVLWDSLKEVFGGLTVNTSFLVGRDSESRNVRPKWDDFTTSLTGSAETKVSSTKTGLQLTGKPTVELLSHSISVRATNSSLFLLELKLQDALDAVVLRRNRNLQLIHDGGDAAPGPREKRIRRFFWDYTHATPFCPEDILSKHCAELLTRDRLHSIATRTLGEVITMDFLESIDTTLDAYIDRELQEFIAKVVRSSYAAIRSQISDHETLIRYELETKYEACDEVKSEMYPNIVRYVTQTLTDELTALQDLVWKLRMAAIAGKHMNVVLNNLALNIHVQFCRMVTGRRNAQVHFCDVFTATETGQVVEELCYGDPGAMNVEMLARIRKVLLEVELIKNEDMIVNGHVRFPDGRQWNSERDIMRRVIRQVYAKMFAATTSRDDEKPPPPSNEQTIELPEVGDETSRLVWVLVVKDARTLFNTFVRTIRRNIHGCRIESLATLGQALWDQGLLEAPQLSILEAVRAEMEDGVLGLAIESVADRILELNAMSSEEEALAQLTSVWAGAEEVTNDDTSLWTMEQIITDSDDAFDSNNNNQETSGARKKITLGEVLDDFQNLCGKLAQICLLTNRLNDQLLRKNEAASELSNSNNRQVYDENTSSNQNVPEDVNENLSGNSDTALDEQSTNQNAASSSNARISKQATVQVDPQENNDRELTNSWIDDTSNAMVQSMGYVLFALLVVLCASSLAGTLALGVTLSPAEAWSWVRIFCIGLACHFFLLETFKVFLVAFFFATCQRKLMM